MPAKKPDPRVQSPNYFIDTLVSHLNLKNDAALSRFMDVAPPVLSKIRHGRLSVTATMLIKAHDATGLSINQLRDILYAPDKEGANYVVR
jgi:plasmid maintenance system antidote protein VapI